MLQYIGKIGKLVIIAAGGVFIALQIIEWVDSSSLLFLVVGFIAFGVVSFFLDWILSGVTNTLRRLELIYLPVDQLIERGDNIITNFLPGMLILGGILAPILGIGIGESNFSGYSIIGILAIADGVLMGWSRRRRSRSV